MMNRIKQVFRKQRVLLPVIHCIEESQARRNVDVAFENGADGVFLINQGGMDGKAVLGLAARLAGTRDDPARFVGVNILGASPSTLIDKDGVAGIWSDDAGVHGDASEMMNVLSGFRAEREQLRWGRGLWFGGVGFKYQTPISDEWLGKMAVAAALGGVDVITTSGMETGQPPTVEKIELLAEALRGHAIAIASGITPENVASFLPFAHAFLVATGIERVFGELDPHRVRAAAEAVHSAR